MQKREQGDYEMSKIPAGIVTGDDYLALVQACKEGGYALPAVNVTGTNTINAVLEASAASKSDVIIQMSGGGAGFFAGASLKDTQTAAIIGGVSAARHIDLVAKHYGIAVIMHTDHANRKLLPWVDGLTAASEENFRVNGKPLYSSHMIDLSEESVADNVATCAEFLERMAKVNLSLEIELGVTGGEEDGVGHDVEDMEDSSLYTQPEDVLYAYDILKDLGHFSVAAAFGNVHGVYKPGNIKLEPKILTRSQDLIEKTHGMKNGSKPLDFVFHGGSGSELQAIHEAISYGVFKMNLDTDTQFAFAEGIGTYVANNSKAFCHQLDPDTFEPYKKVYDPRKWLRAGELSVVARVKQSFEDLGSIERSIAS
jgi:fructose-bisphosphate aldolase class II